MCESEKNAASPRTLYGVSYPSVSVDGAMEKTVGLTERQPFVLAYTPDFCGFVQWKGKAFHPLGGGKPIDHIFELRCFCDTFELRWGRDGATERGRAVLLYDSGSNLSLPDVKCEHKGLWTLEGRYLLWGQGRKRGETVRLFEHRVGELPVPAEVKEDDRAFLTFLEYFRPDEYGNMTFLTERLTGLELGMRTSDKKE